MKDVVEKDNFPHIIGYEDTKRSLNIILDVIKNLEKYKKLGVHIPHGLLLSGVAGVGKSSLAEDFIKATNRKSYIIRKNKSNGAFIDYMNDTFKEAKKNAPSIILLDDIDKFSDTDKENYNSEEYVAIQSLIDSIKDDDVFIIATASNTNTLPYSLLRDGRFDNQFKLKVPTDKEAQEIIEYYLKNKKVAQDICTKDISQILSENSCATLEKVVNEAGILAGYQNRNEITQEHMIRTALSIIYDASLDSEVNNSKYLLETAYHEAGHALIAEILEPSSISYVTAIIYGTNLRGYTMPYDNRNYGRDFISVKNRVKALLAGRAAVEVVYGKIDVGSTADFTEAYELTNCIVDDFVFCGFETYEYNGKLVSEKFKEHLEAKINVLISEYYQEVKSILIQNRTLLDKIAHELAERGILFSRDIAEIKAGLNNYKIDKEELK